MAAESARIYCRIRPVFKWEKPERSVKVVDDTTVRSSTRRGPHEYSFTHVFGEKKKNKDVFEKICTPLIKTVLSGANAILIAYGQTGSGKTHTLQGKPKINVKGLLPLALTKFYESKGVIKVELLAVEAYGVHVNKVEIFDLFSKESSPPAWEEKKGNTQIEPKRCQSRVLTDPASCFKLIEEAHAASHFAPTGKNPESSRGHTVFIVRVSKDEGNDMIRKSHFICADLAGSEGESAITPAFVKKSNPAMVMVRRLEAGCINVGLTQLSIVFDELAKKKSLSKVRGTGLRRILHPFINTKTAVSVLFTVNSTKCNAVITQGTMKFAVSAALVKCKAVVEKAKKNLKKLLKNLEETLVEQNKSIESYNNDLGEKEKQEYELEEELHNLKNEIAKKEEEKKLKKAPSLRNVDSNLSVNRLNKETIRTAKRKRRHQRKATTDIARTILGELKEEIDFDSAPSPMNITDPKPVSVADHFLTRETLQFVGKTNSSILRDEKKIERSRAASEVFTKNILLTIHDDMQEVADIGFCDDEDDESDYERESVRYPEANDENFSPFDADEVPEDQLFENLESLDEEELIERLEQAHAVLFEKSAVCDQFKNSQSIMMEHMRKDHEAVMRFFLIRYPQIRKASAAVGVMPKGRARRR